MEQSDVVTDDGCMSGNGCAHGYSVSQADGERKRYCLSRKAEKKHIFYKAKNSNQAGELDFTYYNAVYTVENALAKVKDEKGMKRVEKFLKEEICPQCQGSRLSEKARAPKLRGIGLAEACQMTLKDLVVWVADVPDSLPEEMRPMAESICESFQTAAKRLMDLGLSYCLSTEVAATLSTGGSNGCSWRAVKKPYDRCIVRVGRAFHRLHPSNINGLNAVMHESDRGWQFGSSGRSRYADFVKS